MAKKKIYQIPQDTTIVKIQQSITSSYGIKIVLVYDKSRAIFFESEHKDLVKPILKLLKKRLKGYFRAKMINDKLNIYDEVATQDW